MNNHYPPRYPNNWYANHGYPAMPPQGYWPPIQHYAPYPYPPGYTGMELHLQAQAVSEGQQTASNSFFNIRNPRFIKGALIGAAAIYLLSNERAQQGAIKTAVKAWSLVQGGVEEMKERFRDAEAEMHSAQTDN